MKKLLTVLFAAALAVCAFAEKQYLWPEGQMPDAQAHQIAALLTDAKAPSFNPDEWRAPYLDWHETKSTNGVCAILISGGSYKNLCDISLLEKWKKTFEGLGCQCVTLVYRTPRPEGIEFYRTAWEDGQRAVRLVRAAAGERGFDPEKIVTVSMSAGSHLSTLLATSSQTPAYERIDALDDTPCHVNAAIAFAPAYLQIDGLGKPNSRAGEGDDTPLDGIFKFDAKTAPMCLLHGGKDPYSPIGSTKLYRALRIAGVPAEIHLFPDKGHGAFGLERGVEFLRQLGLFGELEKEVALKHRFADDSARAVYERENIWPEGAIPDLQERQSIPYIEWHIPSNLTTKAIQVVWSGGSYQGSKPNDFEVAPIRRYLNEKGMAVVTLNYRHPRPAAPLAKHTTAWQDAQRAIRIVRSKAASYGLDPDRIGVMGSSAGGHLVFLAATSSKSQTYWPIDEIDKLPCSVQWAVAVYPAYSLTDGINGGNKNKGNTDEDRLAPCFAFDLATPRFLFLHGDSDAHSPMASVKAWEQLRRMGIQSELHTLVKRGHCFHRNASPGTASYNFPEMVWAFVSRYAEGKAR